MKTEKKILSLVEHGFKPSTLLKLNENQINLLFNKLQEQVQQIQTTKTIVGPKGGNVPVKPGQQAISVKPVPNSAPGTMEVTEDDDQFTQSIKFSSGEDPQQDVPQDEGPSDNMDADDGMGMFETELDEKFESKAQQGLFWARCNKCSNKDCKWCKMAKEFSKSTSKKQYEKMPEKKHPEKTVKYKKKETKENYLGMIEKAMSNNIRKKTDDIKLGVSFDNMSESKLEKNIMKLVEKHITPKMSKKDLISFVLEQGTKEKEKERTKEKEKEKSPNTPYKPKPGPKPNPKAKKTEVDEQETAPVKTPPKTKPTEKPKKPGTPYSPKPGPKPAPKAKKGEMPNWLSFNKIGINLK